MSSYTIEDLKNDVVNHLHGTTLNKVPGIYALIYEAGRNLLNSIDPFETKRTTNITNALFDQVYSYAVPTDLKGAKIVDIRPQEGMEISDEMSRWFNTEFAQYKERANGIFAVQNNSGVRTIQISKDLTGGVTLHTMDSVSDNGTWINSGNAGTPTADTINKLSGNASIRFSISAIGSNAALTNSSLASVDLSSMENEGSIFMWVFLSAPDAVNNISLYWGTDSSNYWSQTVTQTHDGFDFVVGWNLVRFDMSGANETGSPDIADIGYLNVNINFDGTEIPTVRLDNIVARPPQIFEIEYYSKYLFTNSSGDWIEKPSADTDSINLDTDSYNVLLYELMVLVGQVIQSEDSKFDTQFFIDKKDEAWKSYRKNHKSEEKKSSSTYYRPLYTKRR
jgi:hypothetical protein